MTHFRSGKMSGLMQDRDSFFNDRITHLDDIQFSRNTRTGILIEDEKDFSDVRKSNRKLTGTKVIRGARYRTSLWMLK